MGEKPEPEAEGDVMGRGSRVSAGITGMEIIRQKKLFFGCIVFFPLDEFGVKATIVCAGQLCVLRYEAPHHTDS